MRRGELTPGEIKANAPKPDEGFTVRATGKGVGKNARNVLSVGITPDEAGRAAEVPIDSSMSTEEQMRTFNVNRLGILGGEGGPFGIGGWNDPETKNVVMDSTVLLPRTTGGLSAAMRIGTEHGQAAIGNLGKTGYIGDINIPSYIQKGQFFPEERTITDLGNIGEGGRQRVKIVPSRQEMVDVEAEFVAKDLNFPDDPLPEGLRRAYP
jgi:hypothetical protein